MTLGTLTVPPGFKAETVNYKEGIVTTLTYPDGARVVLQRGGMYAIPMLHHPEYIVDGVIDNSHRKGHHDKQGLVWAERNFKFETVKKPVRFPSFFPPNIAYSNVPAARRAEFDRALDSFRH